MVKGLKQSLRSLLFHAFVLLFSVFFNFSLYVTLMILVFMLFRWKTLVFILAMNVY